MYGLGALENLKGEILVLDSQIFIAKEINDELNSFDQKLDC